MALLYPRAFILRVECFMLLFLLAYIGGVLTILSPCILPVLPFVFSSAGQSFRRSTLPLLAGMAVTFAAVSTLAVVGGGWAVHANTWGRWIALALLWFFALTLLFPELAEKFTQPLTRFGGLLHAHSNERGPGASFILGIATGFLWAPCAGPILGLILTSAALRGASASTSGLLLAYALGAATSLALALAAGGKLLSTLKKYLGADLWIRRILGVAVLLGVLTIILGWDRGVLTKLSQVSTDSIEQRLLQLLPNRSSPAQPMHLPELAGAVAWINSPSLAPDQLKGKVVLVDFWTYSCINCLRSLPYVIAWAEKYKTAGFVVVGVHTPEFAFERKESNVRQAVKDLKITYPVAMDNNYAIWNAFSNQYWPAHYLADDKGQIRYHHFGEGEYERTERRIQEFLKETGAKNIPEDLVNVKAIGAQAPSLDAALKSPETYLGYSRSENGLFIPELKKDQEETYRIPGQLVLNQWSLGGTWNVHPQHIHLTKAPGKIVYRFHARDLHLVLGPGLSGKPIRFQVRLDGKQPGNDHGTDIDEAGRGVVKEQRLYQLIRQDTSGSSIGERTFEIEFLDPDVQAYAFTFG
jgi:cytochrome c biogenesis protein CcdA/thiol-disulfide isomerase/thioredoxin